MSRVPSYTVIGMYIIQYILCKKNVFFYTGTTLCLYKEIRYCQRP